MIKAIAQTLGIAITTNWNVMKKKERLVNNRDQTDPLRGNNSSE